MPVGWFGLSGTTVVELVGSSLEGNPWEWRMESDFTSIEKGECELFRNKPGEEWCFLLLFCLTFIVS